MPRSAEGHECRSLARRLEIGHWQSSDTRASAATMPKADRSPGLSSERPTSAASAMPSDARPTTAMRSAIETAAVRDQGQAIDRRILHGVHLALETTFADTAIGREIARSRRAPTQSRLPATSYNPRRGDRKRNHVAPQWAFVPVAVRKTGHLVFNSRAWHKTRELENRKLNPGCDNR